MSGHSGRCFRSWRRTKARKLRQGKTWDYPTRSKVPLAMRPFMAGVESRTVRVVMDLFERIAARFEQHRSAAGKS